MNKKQRAFIILLDILVVFISFIIFIWIKPASRRIYLPKYIIPAIILLVLWLIISVIFKKYKIEEYFNRRKIFISILACNFSIFGFSSLFLYIFQLGYFSRLIVLGTFILPTIIEFVLGYIIYSIFKARPVPSVDEIAIAPLVPVEKEKFKRPDKPLYLPHTDIVDSIVELASENVYSYIADYIEITEPKTYVIATTTIFNIISLPGKTVNNIINLLEINDIRRINKFFEAVNRKIPVNGYFVSCVETQDSRKRRLTRKYPLIISYPYYLIDFIFKRVFPKVWGLKKLYFLITAGRNRVLSKAEVLGRLVSCGFQIIDYKKFNNLLYIISIKRGEPAYDLDPTYGPLIKMTRIGKNGKLIKVHKFRTMHPYSEYLQNYVFSRHHLQNGGKFKDDFRITTLGKFLRKFWIDELPMLINLLKGELKLFGVRPLSEQYFSLYTKELQEKRIKYKPGLVPPFYVDKPETLEEIIASEVKYLNEYEKHPFRTDFRYFFIAIYNIIIKHYRSA